MRYENKTQINRTEWHYFINGEFNSIQNLDMRMFFPQELDTYLEWNGFSIILMTVTKIRRISQLAAIHLDYFNGS